MIVVTRAVPAKPAHGGRARSRSCCSARCSRRCRSSAFDQTINLFSLAGLAIAIGEMADATIVIVENCTAELASQRGAAAAEREEDRAQLDRVASTKPLLFSLLIILASFLPVFFLERARSAAVRSAGYSKTFAMAFSTLLTLFLLPIDHRVDLQARQRSRGGPSRRAVVVRRTGRALAAVIRLPLCVHRRSALLVLISAVVMLPVPEGLPAGDGRGLDPLHADDAARAAEPGGGWILQQMDKKLKAFPEVERVFGKIGRADTSTDPAPLDDDRDDGAAEAEVEVAAGHDEGQARSPRWTRRCETSATSTAGSQPIRGARDDAGHRHPDAGRHQGEGTRRRRRSRRCRSRSRRCCAACRARKSVIAERISRRLLRRRRGTTSSGWREHGVTVDEAMATVRYAIGGDNIVGVKQADNDRRAAERAVLARVHRHARQGARTRRS